MSTVAVTDAVKKYDAVAALDGVTMTFRDGEFFGLLGPSGSGKTTLLRAIAGFVTLDRGQVLIDGQDVGGVPVHARNIGMVFQNYALFPHMSVAENVAFGLEVRGRAREEVAQRVKEALAMVRLGGLEQRKPKQLSGGQQQRVALARALVTRPKVLLLDEPLGALDLKLRKQMQLELKTIQQEVGITFIYVTHDQEEAMTMSDRLAVMRHGKTEQIGGPEEVYEHPATPFVAGFLGASNLLAGELKAQSNGTTQILTEGGSLVRAETDRIPDGLSGEVQVGVRPEKITLVLDEGEAPSDHNQVSGVVRMSTYIGVNYQYEVEGPGGHMLRVYVQNIGAAGSRPNAGDKVRLEWLPEHTFVVERSDTEPEEGE